MAIVQTMDVYDFRAAFDRAGRQENFSYEGLEILFTYLEEIYSEDNWEIDVIGLCCEFSEMTFDEVINTYLDLSDDELDEIKDDEDEKREKVIQYLNENTSVCGYDDDIVVFADF